MNQNPFQQSMVRMQAPTNGGSAISARGFSLDTDKDGCVTVPADIAADLKSHGFVEAPPKK